MKWCGKCGKRVDATRCPYCDYSQDKTYFAIKVRHSKKSYFFIGSGIFVAIIIALTLNWAVNDGHGPLYDRGDFVLHYEEVVVLDESGETMDLRVTTESNRKIDALVRNTLYFENMIDDLNEKFKLPYDIPVHVGECGFINAFWAYTVDKMVICYEIIDIHFIIFNKIYPGMPSDQLVDWTLSGVHWVIIHELGHAFLDVYKIPLLGPQEDTADSAANIILLSEGPTGLTAILAASEFFDIVSEGQELTDVYRDLHGLNAERYTFALCFIFGSDPGRFTSLVADDYLTLERSKTCEKEYKDNYAGWAEVLEPYTKIDI